MYIHEATKEAMKRNACITVPEFKGVAKIQPTDGNGNCIAILEDGTPPSRYGWQPTASDLTRSDWIVIS